MPDRFGDKGRIEHMLKAIKTIESYTQKVTFEQFQQDNMRLDACIRQLGIVGEAANRVSPDLIAQYPSVPWRQIIGLRNILIHEYFGVDDKSIWDIITVNLPFLKENLQGIFRNSGLKSRKYLSLSVIMVNLLSNINRTSK